MIKGSLISFLRSDRTRSRIWNNNNLFFKPVWLQSVENNKSGHGTFTIKMKTKDQVSWLNAQGGIDELNGTVVFSFSVCVCEPLEN